MGRNSAATRSSRDLKLITQRREDAINAMNDKLREKFHELEQMFADSREQNLRFYYRVGQICQEIRDNPQDYDSDNVDGYTLLEQALSVQARTLRKARQFAEAYKKPELLEELINLKHEATGFRLHWGHVTYLLGLNTEKQRSSWAARAVRNLWDPPALHAAIKDRFGDRGRGGGRPQVLPATTHMQIRQMMETTRKWVSKYELWNGAEENVFSNVENEAPDEIEPIDLENLRSTLELIQSMRSSAAIMEDQIGACIKHVEDVLSAREQAEEAEKERAAAAGKQHRSINLDSEEPTKGRRRVKKTAATT